MLKEINGQALDWNSMEFLVATGCADLTYREGMGDALAEGGCAPRAPGHGRGIVRGVIIPPGAFPAIGTATPTFCNNIVYPFWIVGALHWAMDTRDPASSTHDYIQNVMYWGPLWAASGTAKSAHHLGAHEGHRPAHVWPRRHL